MEKRLWFALFGILFFVPLLFVWSACGWVHGDLSKDSRFNAEDLAEGGMGIAGVVVAGDGGEGHPAPGDLAALLRTEIIEARHGFEVVSDGIVERFLGAEGYSALLETYSLNRSVPPGVLSKIAPDLEKRFRFLVLVAIERDTVSTRIKPRKQSGDARPSTDYITTREVGATFHVYDLETITLAWTVYLTASADRTLTHRQHDETPSTVQSFPYPEAIGLDKVAVFLFDEFAWRLPGFRPAGGSF